MHFHPLKSMRERRRRFYDGPALYNYPGRKLEGYRSPNLLLLYWARAFFYTHFTLGGILLFLLTGLVGLVSMFSTSMPVFLLCFALLGVFAVNVIIGYLLRPRLTISRVVPDAAPAHTPIRIDYHVVHHRRRPVWDVYFDLLPATPGLRTTGSAPWLEVLPGHGVAHLSGTVEASRRGEFTLPQPIADSAFPFGLWRWGCRGEPNKPILIYPDYTPLHSFRVEAGRKYQAGLMAPTNFSDNSMEFFGCREYRYGDNPRHIHGLSWARLRQPIVKEFREEYMCRIALLLDTHPRTLPPWLRLLRPVNPPFEASISLTAAIAEYLLRQDYRVDFYALGRPPLRGGGGRGRAYLRACLALLASLKEGTGDFPGIPNELVGELREISAAVVVVQRWDPARQAVVSALRDAGIATRIVLVADGPGDLPDDPDFTRIAAADILAGNVTAI